MSTARRRCRRCASPLARDNADTLCSACEQQRPRDRAPDVPSEFWRTALVGIAPASGDFGRVLRMYRFHPSHGRPLRQSVVADWLHVSQSTLHRIEYAKRHVTIDEIDSFTRALGIPLALRWTPQSESGEDVNPLSRRSLLGAGIGAAAGLNATTAPAAAREVDPELVAHWIKLLRVLDHHDANCGPHDALDTVCREIDLIARHRQIASGALQQQLLCVESRWAQFASWLSNDAGDAHRRDAWADQALRLAEAAGYSEMVAYVLMRQSRWAVEDQNARRAKTFAEAARGVSHATPQVRALAALRKAQGHALAGDHVACEHSITDTYELLDGADAPQSPWDQLTRLETTRPFVMAEDARCWLWLRPRKAITMYEEVLRLWPSDRGRSRGVQQACLALACAAADEPERAATEGLRALQHAQTTRSNMTVRALRQLDRRLAACDTAAVGDFREAFATL
jgi:Helix-turn-helix domain